LLSLRQGRVISTLHDDALEIPLTVGLRRRASTVALMARTVPRAGIDARELDAILTRAAAEADGAPLHVIVSALWRIEATLAGAARHPRGDAPLVARSLPESTQPIAHVGWATGLGQRLGFDPDVLRGALERSTREPYRGFCWDGVGADLLVHARPAIRIGGRAIGMIGGHAAPPDSSGGFAAFRGHVSREESRLAAHGVGRVLLVTHASIRGALRQADRLPSEWQRPAVQGIAFACLMLNHADAHALLEGSGCISHAHASAFHDGLVYALVFADWLGRGLLRSWQPSGSFEARLVARARREADLNARRGHPLPFAVSDATGPGRSPGS
jgi:hypothetical protein